MNNIKWLKGLLLVLLVLPQTIYAQDWIKGVTTLDTLFVVEKKITQNSEINVGAKIEQIPLPLLEINTSRSLAELLAENTSISVKSMGLGALATASFRGASAAQTRVNWNGVNITPVMAGIFDFSQMPVFFADNVMLFHGSNDVKSGTGAVGGSVNISNTPFWDGLTRVEVGGEYGSYNTYTGKVSARYGTNRLSMKTRAYYQHSDNDYSYLNKVSSNEAFRERRADAQFTMFSALQELHYRVSPNAFISSAFWYQNGRRMLPQPLGVETTVHEKQREQNIRAFLGYDLYRNSNRFSLKAAYIQYGMRYDRWFDNDYFDPTGNTNSSYSSHFSADYLHQITERLLYNGTLTYRHDLAVAESYREIDMSKYEVDGTIYTPPEVDPPARRHRDILSFHNALRWRPLRWLTTDGRMMLETVDWEKPVFTYSLGAAATVVPNALHLRSSISYNFRQPSLNELYWRPGGNPDVLPEEGMTYDATLSYKQPLWSEQLVFSTEATAYMMDIDNWILWLPTDETTRGGYTQNQWLWRPQNKRDVRSKGVDLLAKLAYTREQINSTLTFSYAYTKSYTRTKQHEDDGALLKQIPYVPKQKWNIRLFVNYKRLFVNFQTSYVGVRYITTDQSYFTYPYNVCNLLIGFNGTWGKRVMVVPQLRIDNLFNTYYESTQYYPMPLRTVLGSLTIKF